MKRDKDLYPMKHSSVFTFDKYKVGTFPQNVLKEMVEHFKDTFKYKNFKTMTGMEKITSQKGTYYF